MRDGIRAILFDAGGTLIHPDGRRISGAAGVAYENLWSSPADGAAQTLTALRARGYRLGVVSNADGRVRTLLDRAGLTGFLELIVDSADAGLEKPDPRIFLAAAERMALPPSACAYVGDIYEIDILGARAAGFEAVLIGSCPAPEPVARVPDLASLLPLFP